MPVGKVKFYDAERGFGFVGNPGHDDCFVGKEVLPEGVDELVRGQRIEFDFATGKRGPQALRIKILDTPKAARKPHHRHTPEKLHGMIGDVVTLMESKLQPDLRQGRWPDGKTARQISEILRAIADELDA